jgi:hypothetical protein
VSAEGFAGLPHKDQPFAGMPSSPIPADEYAEALTFLDDEAWKASGAQASFHANAIREYVGSLQAERDALKNLLRGQLERTNKAQESRLRHMRANERHQDELAEAERQRDELVEALRDIKAMVSNALEYSTENPTVNEIGRLAWAALAPYKEAEDG